MYNQTEYITVIKHTGNYSLFNHLKAHRENTVPYVIYHRGTVLNFSSLFSCENGSTVRERKKVMQQLPKEQLL